MTPGTRTENGLRHNVRVGIQYIESWLRGVGCVPIYNLMEDAATAEISRAQVWQWIRHQAKLDDGTTVSPDRFRAVVVEEMERVRAEIGDERFTRGKFQEARELFERLSLLLASRSSSPFPRTSWSPRRTSDDARIFRHGPHRRHHHDCSSRRRLSRYLADRPSGGRGA